jgi:putative ABC transport system permease protein
MTVYHPFEQQGVWGGRLFIHTQSDPYALVSPVTRIIRELSADQPIEGAATLEDIRAEVLAPERLNTIVFGGFALLALTISVVGVAGVLAFSISARSREFAIRLALGAHPRKILSNVLIEGMVIAVIGVAAGAVVGFALTRLLGGYIQDVRLPGLMPLIGSIGVIIVSTVIASALPAARAARVDVMQALRSD